MLKNPSQKRCSKELRDDFSAGYCKRGGNWLISFQQWDISPTLKTFRPRYGGVFNNRAQDVFFYFRGHHVC